MGRFVEILGASALVLAAAACGEVAKGSASSAPAPVADLSGFVPGTRPHMMPMIDPSKPRFAAAQGGGPHLSYYGGHVISNVKVIAVFWGSNVDATTQSQIGGFYTAVNDSPYFDWLQEYDTNIQPQGGGSGTGQHIGRGTFGGAVTISPSVTSSHITDSNVQSELEAQINAGHLPAPDANTLYMTYFPPGVTINDGGQQSCSAFCAYHNTFVHGGNSAFYGVMPDYGSGGCQQGCGNDTTFNNLTSASTHEMIEAVTDPEVGLASGNNPPLAWYDSANGEIGDICNSTDTVAGYVVQTEWSNSRQSCIAADSSVPPSTPTPTPAATPTPTPPAGSTPTPTPGPNPSGTPDTSAHHHGGNELSRAVGGCDVAGTNVAPGEMFTALLSLCGLVAMRVNRRRRV